MNDRSIPFIREYGEWAVLAAARRTTAGWRKHRYRDHTLEVPENKRYLAANAAKRSPNTPRGARFPACPSKRNRTPTTDDDDSQDDGRIPILPPGPSTTSDLAGFPNGGVTWDSGFPSQRPIQPVPGPSQLPFSGFGPFPQAQTSTTPSAVPWDWTDPQNLASSGAPMNVSYWECSPSCEYTQCYTTLLNTTNIKSVFGSPSSRCTIASPWSRWFWSRSPPCTDSPTTSCQSARRTVDGDPSRHVSRIFLSTVSFHPRQQ